MENLNFPAILAACVIAGVYISTVMYRSLKLVIKNSSGKKYRVTTSEDFMLIICYDFADVFLFMWKWLCKAWSFHKAVVNNMKKHKAST